jgi:hypothetical protein
VKTQARVHRETAKAARSERKTARRSDRIAGKRAASKAAAAESAAGESAE